MLTDAWRLLREAEPDGEFSAAASREEFELGAATSVREFLWMNWGVQQAYSGNQRKVAEQSDTKGSVEEGDSPVG